MEFKLEKICDEDNIIHKTTSILIDKFNESIANEVDKIKDFDKTNINIFFNLITSLSYSFLGSCLLKIAHSTVKDKENLETLLDLNKEIFQEVIKNVKEKFLEQKRKDFET